MRKLYVVMGLADGIYRYPVAFYADREAAEQHARLATQEVSRLRQLRDRLQADAFDAGTVLVIRTEPSSCSWWDRWVNWETRSVREYSIVETVVCDHPDQWQDADREERQPNLA